MTDSFPARLHVIFAREKALAVVFRRGPSKYVGTFLWDREKDSFQQGQWLNGRIYERRSDISPDGKYLIYFALNGKWDSETKGSYTAVSRPPWLKAIALYGKGDTWGGGGLFQSKKSYSLDGCHDPKGPLKESKEISRNDSPLLKEQFGKKDWGIYSQRLFRDGWKPTLPQEKYLDAWSQNYEKQLPFDWVLRKFSDHDFEAHEMVNKKSGAVISGEDWEWADLDDETLVWAEKGCIYRATIKDTESLGEPRLLYDFNPLKFEAIQAPY